MTMPAGDLRAQNNDPRHPARKRFRVSVSPLRPARLVLGEAPTTEIKEALARARLSRKTLTTKKRVQPETHTPPAAPEQQTEGSMTCWLYWSFTELIFMR